MLGKRKLFPLSLQFDVLNKFQIWKVQGLLARRTQYLNIKPYLKNFDILNKIQIFISDVL